MPRVIAVPAAADKIGRKIDYLMAAQLGPALSAPGFHRKSRTLWRELGAGPARALQVINLQGNKWNEGSRGSFCINLGVQFCALHELMATQPGCEWLLPYAGAPDAAACTVRGRIDDALPAIREIWWPAQLQAHYDHWFEIDAHTDLVELGMLVARLLTSYAVPWLDTRIDMARFFEGVAPEAMTAGVNWRAAAGVLLDRRGEAEALLASHPDVLQRQQDPAATRAWYSRLGLTMP